MVQCFKTVDLTDSGSITYDGLVKGLEIFGLENLKPYQITALLKFNRPIIRMEETIQTATERSNQKKMSTMLSPRHPDYRIDYTSFCRNLMIEVERNSKLVIEVTHDLIRKIYKMIN